MSAAIPTTAPSQLIAGDTATWQISLSDYPASAGWTLTYNLVRRTGGVLILITTTASGADHLVNVAAADTALYLPGDYDCQAYVTKTTERYQVWSGKLSIFQNFATADGGLDTRTTARKIFDQLEAAILKISTTQALGASGGIVEWTVEGTHIRRSTPELLIAELTKQRDRYATICAREDEAVARANGLPTRKNIFVRFTSPR